MDKLYIKNPFFEKGKMSIICSIINNNQTFAVLAVKLGLHRGFYYDYTMKHRWTELHRFATIQKENGHLLPHQLEIQISYKIISFT